MKKALKITFKVFLGIVALLLLVVVLVQTPPVQNFARKKVQAWLQKKLDTRIEIGRLRIGFPSSVVLEKIYVEDKTKDTLLYGGSIKADINLFKLIKSEVQVGDLRLQDLTAKIKRQLPDTAFNFQFIIDAFVTEQAKPANPADTATALKMSLDNLYLDNIRFIYQDTISGNDWAIQLKHFTSNIKTFDPTKQVYSVPFIVLDGLTARMYQSKPLVTTDDVVNNDSSLSTALPTINLRHIRLKNIDVDYRNNVSAFYTTAKFNELITRVNTADLNNRKIILDHLRLTGTDAKVLMGKAEGAQLVAEKVKTEAQDVAAQSWMLNLRDVNIRQTSFQYDDEAQPRKKNELDFGHLNATNFTLQARSFVMDEDSITASIQQIAFKEQSGLTLQRLQGNLVYTDKKMYADGLLVQTPGTRIKHTIHLDYPSLESIQKDIGSLQVQAVLPDCYVSNKDILFFVPSLKSQPAFSDPSTVFRINANVKGRVNNLTANVLQVQGWKSTKLDVSGSIVGLPNMDKLYGDIKINEIRTTRGDAARFLPASIKQQIEIPATLVLSGTVKGNGNQMRTNVQLKSSSGNIALNGSMANYQNMKAATYNMQVQAQGVQVGSIIKDTNLQAVTANVHVQGKGLTPETADAIMKGTVSSVVFQKYNYKNINLDAAIKNQQANGNVSIADENISLAGSISMNLALSDPSLLADVVIDSIKTKPLNFTAEELAYRGKIKADLASINPDSLQGKINIIHSLLVTGTDRLQVDTLSIVASTSADSNRITIESDIAKARLAGKYKLTQLGNVFMQAIQPYFSVMPAAAQPAPTAKATPAVVPKTEPYNFRVWLYVTDNAALKAAVPSLKQFQTLHVRAHFASDSGWQANATMPVLVANGLSVNDLKLQASGKDSVLNATTTVGTIQFAGNTVYNALVKADIANNKIDFLTRMHDQGGRIKYSLPGVLVQPKSGEYDISLKNDSLLLNYTQWSVAPDNVIHYAANDLRVTNFMLNHNFQQFSLKSRGNMLNAPTEASFTSFQISTLAAFVTPDSLGVDGTLDGQVLLYDLTTKPLFAGDVTVANLNFKGDTVGNVIVKAKNSTADIINANVELTGRGNHATVNGDFYMKPVNGNDFKFNVVLDTLNLATVEGATMGAIKNASGSITGKADVSGSFSKFNIDGGIKFKQTSFNLSMLNSYFLIEDETIAVNNEGIRFDSFTIQDSAKHKATIDGMVYTTDFSKYKFDLTVKADDFQAMNSTKDQNKLYYGQLTFSSNMHIRGTDVNPVVDGNITIGDKTNVTVVLPQTDPSVVKRDGIV